MNARTTQPETQSDPPKDKAVTAHLALYCSSALFASNLLAAMIW